MTIDEAYRFVQFVFNKSQSGNIRPIDFNTLAPIAQISVLNQILGNEQEYQPGHPVPRYGLGITQKVLEDLRAITKPPTPVTFTNGVGTYPADGLYIYDIGLSDNTEVKMVQIDEYRILIKSVIKPPTTQYPIALVLENTIYINPSSITSALITYIRMPATPVWNYTTSGGVPVYQSSGSQDFELGPLLHLRICLKILQAIGVNLNMAQVTQFAAALEAQGS